MPDNKINLADPAIQTIENDDIKEFAKILVENLPAYWWEVGASSTGKYHPQYSLGDGGLMRHSIAVVRFLNFFFELEQYNSNLTDREMDLMRVAALVHDGRKSGEQADYEKSKYTKFNHPILMANVIRAYDGKYLNHDEIEFIASCIESHMGQWNKDKKSAEELPKPSSKYQKFIHLADYLASRKCLTMEFEDYKAPEVTIAPIEEFVLSFGKYKTQKLIDVYRTHPDYIRWLEENVQKPDIQKAIKAVKKMEEDEI